MAAEPSKHEYQTRKRARPSYADDDEELDSILYGDDQTLKASVDAHVHDAEDDDVDVNFAPGKVLSTLYTPLSIASAHI